jgi:hypothetical protein
LKLSRLHIILFLFSAILWNEFGIWAQPSTVDPEGIANLFRLGYNSNNNPFATEEGTDSLTVGAANVRYFINPDLVINPSYNPGVDYNANLVSSFAWTAAPVNVADPAATINAVVGYSSNYKKITFSNLAAAPADYIISVTESANGCSGTPFSFTTRLIANPDITGITIANVTCQSGTIPYNITCPNATLSVSSAVNGVRGVKVTYTITGPAGSGYSYTSPAPVILGNTNSETLNLSGVTHLTHPGAYTLTINTVTDRIATKSGFTAIADGTNTIFYVTPSPVTSPTKHVTNQGW